MLILNNFIVTTPNGVPQFDNVLALEAAPPCGDVSGVVIPVTLLDDADEVIVHTYITDVSDVDVTLAEQAPTGGWAGPIKVVCSPTAEVHACLQSVETRLVQDLYTTSHAPAFGQVSDMLASSYTGSSHSVVLPDQVATAGFDAGVAGDVRISPETVLLFRCDDAAITFTFYPPSGKTLHWESGAPAPSSGLLNVLVSLRYVGDGIFGSFKRFA